MPSRLRTSFTEESGSAFWIASIFAGSGDIPLPLKTSPKKVDIFAQSKVQFLNACLHCMKGLVVFLSVCTINYDIVTDVFHTGNVTNSWGNHILKHFCSSIDSKNETFVSKHLNGDKDVVMCRESGCRGSWWLPWFKSNLLEHCGTI